MLHSDHAGYNGIGHGTPPYAKIGFSCNIITSSDIHAALDKLQIPYTCFTIVESIDISSFLCDNISTDGELLLDIVASKKHFRKTSSVKVRDGALEYYKGKSRTETLDAGDVKSFYDCTSVVTLITKEK